MIISNALEVLGILTLASLLGLSSGDSFTPHIPEEHVFTSLHGSVTLPCSFPFIKSLEGLSMIWEKKENNRTLRIYWILNGQENLKEQDPRYTGRVELSMKFSQGNLNLTLRDVTSKDEGTYYCRAVNQKAPGDRMVTLSIDDNEEEKELADQSTIIIVTATIFIILTIIIITSIVIITFIHRKAHRGKYFLGKKPIKSRPCKEEGCSINECKKKDEGDFNQCTYRRNLMEKTTNPCSQLGSSLSEEAGSIFFPSPGN